MQHDLGHAAGQVNEAGRMADRAIRQAIDQPRHPAIDRRSSRPRSAGGRRHNRQWPAYAGSGWWSRRTRRERPSHCGTRPRSECAAWSGPGLDSWATARAERRAMSSQSGWPDGASAECGSDRPSASPTTCEVAAVPRNWQPPPGLAQVRQPSSAACCKLISPWAKRAPMVWTLPASSPSSVASMTPPGTSTQGRSCIDARAIIIAGSPLSQVATPRTPGPRRQRADQPAEDHRRVVAIGQAVHHAGGALGSAVARVGAEAGEGHEAERLQFLGRRLDLSSDFPVAGVIAQRDRAAVRRAKPAGGAEDQEFLAAELLRVQPMPTFWLQPNRSPLGAFRSSSSVKGRLPAGPRPWFARRGR